MGHLLNFRPQGYETEAMGAADVAPRRMNQRDRLLRHYLDAPRGLTDDDAALAEGLMHTCYWKRCSELRELRYIVTMSVDGHVIHREGHAGSQRIVCFITNKGRAHAQEAEERLPVPGRGL